MGIREKIRLGFLALGLLLFFSGLISFFELSKLSRLDAEHAGRQPEKHGVVQDDARRRSGSEHGSASDHRLGPERPRERLAAACRTREVRGGYQRRENLDPRPAGIRFGLCGQHQLQRDGRRLPARQPAKGERGLVRRYLQDLLFGPDLLDQEFHGLVPEYDGCQGEAAGGQCLPGDDARDSSRW